MECRLVAAWSLCLAVACEPGIDDHGDARPTGVAFSFRFERGDTAHPDQGTVQTYLDGENALRIEAVVEQTTLLAMPHRAELHVGDFTVARFSVDLAAAVADCHGSSGQALDAVDVSVCFVSTGELRSGITQIGMQGAGCLYDDRCAPACDPRPTSSACPGAKCTARVALENPLVTQLGCAPVGTRAIGQPCTRMPDAGSSIDDCDREGVCLAGVCKRTCLIGEVASLDCGSCGATRGFPPEMGLCL